MRRKANDAPREAKEEGKPAVSGMQQVKEYAERLDILFAYSTNGHEIEEFDFTNNTQKTIEAFPTQDELYQRYLKAKVLSEAEVLPLATAYNKQTFNTNPRYYQQVAIRRAIETISKGLSRGIHVKGFDLPSECKEANVHNNIIAASTMPVWLT